MKKIGWFVKGTTSVNGSSNDHSRNQAEVCYLKKMLLVDRVWWCYNWEDPALALLLGISFQSAQPLSPSGEWDLLFHRGAISCCPWTPPTFTTASHLWVLLPQRAVCLDFRAELTALNESWRQSGVTGAVSVVCTGEASLETTAIEYGQSAVWGNAGRGNKHSDLIIIYAPFLVFFKTS